MNNVPEIIKILDRGQTENCSVSAADASRFAGLYRAYLRGAYDAAACREHDERDGIFRLALAAMSFIFLGWIFMMIMVFK